jgi:phage terminase large subunit-like protein
MIQVDLINDSAFHCIYTHRCCHSTKHSWSRTWDLAVSPHTQKSTDKLKHHKAATLFMMDARYGMLAHVKHISLHLEKVLNFSVSILHIPASNL